MTASELKAKYQEANPDGHFFDRKTMKFFGDTMANFGVRKITIFKTNQEVYELYRKRPVKHGVNKSAYFNTVTFEIVHRVEE